MGSAENVTPVNKKKMLNTADNLELEEGSPTIVNLPLNGGNGASSGAAGGAGSEKSEQQTIPNIPSSDFANSSVFMAESVFNLVGVDD